MIQVAKQSERLNVPVHAVLADRCRSYLRMIRGRTGRFRRRSCPRSSASRTRTRIRSRPPLPTRSPAQLSSPAQNTLPRKQIYGLKKCGVRQCQSGSYHDEGVGSADDHGERVHQVAHLARQEEHRDAGDDPERRADGEEGLQATAVPLDLLQCVQLQICEGGLN